MTLWFGQLLKCNSSHSQIIATPTSICGASTIMTAGAAPQAKEDNVVVVILNSNDFLL